MSPGPPKPGGGTGIVNTSGGPPGPGPNSMNRSLLCMSRSYNDISGSVKKPPCRVGSAQVERIGTPRILDGVKAILPDGSELELPDGATGLDAARAIGPKLA